MRLLIRIIFVLVGLSLVGVAIAASYFYFILAAPHFEAPREVAIKKHAGLREIAGQLEKAGVVRSALAMMVYARGTGQEQRLHSGDYYFAGAETLEQVLHHLVKGDFVIITVSVPEGLTAHQIAERLQEAGLGCDPDFEEAVRGHEVVRSLGLGPLGAEGYLFPATYKFSPKVSTVGIMSVMLGKFFDVLTPTVERRMFEEHLTARDLITMASIVEKEAKTPAERPLIASVFYNRLRLHMPLQSDPTAQYNVEGVFEPAAKAVHTPSMFNTYDFAGLPPGPIASPGLPSIKAALYPAHSDYLYFVARRDGTHIFSRSLQDHNHAILSLRKGASPPAATPSNTRSETPRASSFN